MKFKSLKFISTSIIAVAITLFVTSCVDQSGKNSSTSSNSGTDTSAEAMAKINPAVSKPDTVAGMKKKTGKVSATMSTSTDANTKMEMDKMGYYNRTEILPAYKGGQNALENYITNSIEYPQEAIDNNAEGTVSVQFAVDEKGNISNVKAIGNKLGYGLEEEAVKVVSKMPVWVPGQIKGKNVKTWRILPITYKIES